MNRNFKRTALILVDQFNTLLKKKEKNPIDPKFLNDNVCGTVFLVQ